MSKDQSTNTAPTQATAAEGPLAPSEFVLADTAYLNESPPQAATLPASQAAPNRELEGNLPLVPSQYYEVFGEFARGGLGRILRAKDLRLGRTVALKELLSNHGNAEARFLREALLTARLEHPSIVPVHEAGRWPSGEPFYAMKMISGQSLDKVLEGRSFEERLSLLPHVIAVCEAIAFAHEARIIHRDLKPQNILVGAFGETVVIDWGLAKEMGAPSDAPVGSAKQTLSSRGLADGEVNLTADGAIMGTPAYMPLEQAENSQDVDERADVYALGAILYHLLAGEAPYRGSGLAIIMALVLGPPAHIAERAPKTPKDLLALVTRAMARDPRDRYPTAKELAADLKKFQAGQLVSVHQYSLRELLARWLFRHRAAVSVGAFALVVVIAGSLFFVGSLIDEQTKTRKEKERAEQNEQRARQEESRAKQQEELAQDKADALALISARALVEREPDEALRVLQRISPRFSAWGALRILAAEALSRRATKEIPGGGRSASLTALDISSDDAWIAFPGQGSSVALYNTETEARRALLGHSSRVTNVHFSPDGQTLASKGLDGSARLWDVSSGQSVALHGTTTSGGWRGVGLAFSPEGRLLAQLNTDGALQLWKLTTSAGSTPKAEQALLLSEPGSMTQPTALAFSPDGKTIAVGGGDLLLWDVATAKARRSEELSDYVFSLAFSPDGASLAVGALGSLSILEIQSAKRQKALEAPEQHILGVAFSADGQRLAYVGSDEQLRVWEPATNKQQTLRGAKTQLTQVIFSRDGQRIIAGEGAGTTIYQWEPQGLRALSGHQSDISALKLFHHQEALLSAEQDGTLRMWRLSQQESLSLEGPAEPSFAVSADQKTLAYANASRGVSLRSADGKDTRTFSGGAQDFTSIALSPDGRWLAGGARDHLIYLWDLDDGSVERFAGHQAPVTRLVSSPDGHYLASSAGPGVYTSLDRGLRPKDQSLRLLDVDTGEVRSLIGHEGQPHEIAFSPDGTQLLIGDERGVFLWALSCVLQGQECQEGRRIFTSTEPMRGLAFSPDGNTLGAANTTGVFLLDLKSGDEVLLGETIAEVYRLVFSPDGAHLAVATAENSAIVWEVETRERRRVLRHQNTVFDVAFAPDGKSLATASSDQSVRLWDLETGESRIVQQHHGWVHAVAYFGNIIVSAGEDRTLRLSPDELPDEPSALRALLTQLAR